MPILVLLMLLATNKAVPACRSTDRPTMRPVAAHPDRDAWLLHRAWPECNLLKMEVPPFVAERLSAPQADYDVERFVQQPGTFHVIGRFAHRAKARIAKVPQAHTQGQPPPR